MPPPRLAILTGAGFSKPAGFPLANEFVATWREQHRGVGAPFSHILRLVDDLKTDNIEQLLEAADNLADAGQRRWLGRSIRSAIFDRLLGDQRNFTGTQKNWRLLNGYFNFLALAGLTSEIGYTYPIITLNYDCLFEGLIYLAEVLDNAETRLDLVHAEIDYIIHPRPYKTGLCGRPVIPMRRFEVYKLHGSIHWDWCETHGLQQLVGPDRYTFSGTCRYCGEPAPPKIMYPTEQKEPDHWMTDLRELAFERMREADLLVIIGVQFAKGDHYLLDEIRRKERVVVVDPCATRIADVIRDRIAPPEVVAIEGKFEDVFAGGSPELRARFEAAVGVGISDLQVFKEAGGAGEEK